MPQQVLSVAQINQYIQEKMDTDPVLSGIAVRGEISNYKVYPSGHHYFSLKDDQATIRCVMFRGNALKLRFQPENGMQIIAIGKISVYPRDGAYQLYCTNLSLDGVGDLHAAFEQLKKKLAAEGLFEQSHKKQLPLYPGTIGIITSSAGAAVHDMLRILRKRYPLTKVRLLPVRVQGLEAPGEIAAAIKYANLHKLADLLIVGRGGGSIEDLWAFNDPQVAYAIYDSIIPVISAVGHEPDVTISDYVADLRAATPSNAAELAVPDQDALRQSLDSLMSAMVSSLSRRLKASRQQLNTLSGAGALQSPTKYIEHRRNAMRLLTSQLYALQQDKVGKKKQQFLSLTAKLDAMSPLKVLTRGYSFAQTERGEVLRSVAQVKTEDSIFIRLADGSLNAVVRDVRSEINE